MQMILFFDTETTGLPKDYKAPPENTANWPRMVQLAYMLDDENHTETYSRDWIIKPEGFEIPQEAARVHGIAQDRALGAGVALETALTDFYNCWLTADLLVAHNISFDLGIVGAELCRGGWSNFLGEKPTCCTMRSSVDLCAIPAKHGRGFKWPRLMELHHKLFGCDFAGAHDAANDVAAGVKCYWELKRRGLC